MKTRRIKKPDDLPELIGWYHDHGWESISERMFPPTGFMVDDHGAVWLFVDEEARMGFMAWMVINPRKNRALAFRALHLLYDRVEREAANRGLSLLTHTVSHSSLKKLAEQHNYSQGDSGLTSYWKVL